MYTNTGDKKYVFKNKTDFLRLCTAGICSYLRNFQPPNKNHIKFASGNRLCVRTFAFRQKTAYIFG